MPTAAPGRRLGRDGFRGPSVGRGLRHGDFAASSPPPRPPRSSAAIFSPQMIRLAARCHPAAIRWCLADALALPFPDASFTLVSCAFGVRNFQYLDRGLEEMHRVLAPAGRAVILEFSLPQTPFLSTLYRFYFHRVLPRLAA